MSRFLFALSALYLIVGCGEIEDIGAETNDHVTRSEVNQTDKNQGRPRVSAQFNAQSVITDAFYNDVDALSETAIQQFLENSPYGRSWLADASTSQGRVSNVVKRLSIRYQINPILLLSRMQVESSLVSAHQRPSGHRVDFAMGCGCHDGTNCAYAPRGLGPQLECAAEKFRGLYEKSANGTGWWRKGLPKDTLDYYRIVPKSHATAGLYAYTPWVLPNSGGTWLAWNIARQFDQHVADWSLSQDSGPSSSGNTGNNETDSSNSSNNEIYTVGSGGTCWEAGSVLGCVEGVVVCNLNRTCQTLQVGDQIACSLDACAADRAPQNNERTEPAEVPVEAQACSQYTVPNGGSCWDAAQALGCSEASLVNCTEPSASCGTMWSGDVLACSRNCCDW